MSEKEKKELTGQEEEVQNPEDKEKEDLEELREIFLKEDPGFSWYFLNVLSTQEHKVKERVERFIEEENLQDEVLNVLLPEITEFTINKGVKETRLKKLYPGYLLVKMRTVVSPDEDEQKNLSLWYRIRRIDGVIDFVGTKEGHIPIPVSERELLKVFKAKKHKEETRRYEFNFGDKVKVINGPFTDFVGEVEDIEEQKLKLKVIISVFGRQTPVEIGFDGVEKI